MLPRWAALAMMLTSAGCASAPPPTPEASHLPVASSASAGATVVVTGAGRIACPMPYGCQASLAIVEVVDAAATLDPEWLPDEAAAFALTPGDGSTWMVGDLAGGPLSLAPGRYLVVGATATISDVASGAPGTSDGVLPVLSSDECVEPLDVADQTVEVHVDATFDGQSCTLVVATTSAAGLDCPERPWPKIGLGGLPGMTATSLDLARIELHNGTGRQYSFRVDAWEHARLETCDALLAQEIVRGPIAAGDTFEFRVGVPFHIPVTIAFWDQRCGEACVAEPFAAMLVTRSPERPMATD